MCDKLYSRDNGESVNEKANNHENGRPVVLGVYS